MVRPQAPPRRVAAAADPREAPGRRPLPSYMGVVVSSSVSQSGSTISGNVTKIVVVATNPNYAPNPGNAGTGVVVATYCQ